MTCLPHARICLLALASALSLALFLLLAFLLSKLEEAPPEQWRKYSLILTGSAFASAALAAAIEVRGRPIQGRGVHHP